MLQVIALVLGFLYFGFNCFLLGQHFDYMLAVAPEPKNGRYWFYLIVTCAVLLFGIPSLLLFTLTATQTPQVDEN